MAARSPARKTAAASNGDTVAARLAGAGLSSDWDFVLHLPLRYEDQTRVVPIAELQVGVDAQVEGTVIANDIVYRGRRQLRVTVRDDSGALVLRFLNFYPSQVKQMAVGRHVRVYGSVRGSLAGQEMVHPRVAAAAESDLPTALTPIYPAPVGIPQAWLRKRIERALRAAKLSDALPSSLVERHGLMPLASALRRLHQPPPQADLNALTEKNDPAWSRIKFDELLAQQIALRVARASRDARIAPALAAAGDLTTRLLTRLPFALTTAQQRAWHEIEQDLARARPMHRLLQGDVGSGKTIVAALAAARAIECGLQAALMAPTELLAEQHFRRIEQWLAPLGVHVAWLAGRLTAAEKRSAQRAIRAGEAQLIVGTHALIQQAVEFAKLGLAIVDEQHRFGVAQRLALRGDETANDAAPHMLMLSATPIPRTLAMSYLADLDVSTIDQLPPGRRPVVTKLVSNRRRDDVLQRIRADVRAGRQAYWVCPLVEASESVEAVAATEAFETIREQLPELRIGLAHGALPAADKTEVMRQFVAREIDLLVATTVIEVGVDVANATLMVIEHAERFGLAQLHQLRGRVGRGAEQSYCILLYEEPLGDTARERLKAIYETHDGFEIARRDLMMRGPGEFLGARQSGLPLLRFADLQRDAGLVDKARDAAGEMLARHPESAREHLQRWYSKRNDFLIA